VRGRRGAGWYAQRWPLLGDKQHTKAYPNFMAVARVNPSWDEMFHACSSSRRAGRCDWRYKLADATVQQPAEIRRPQMDTEETRPEPASWADVARLLGPPDAGRVALWRARRTMASSLTSGLALLPDRTWLNPRGADGRIRLWIVGAREQMEGELARQGLLADLICALWRPAREHGLDLILCGPEMREWTLQSDDDDAGGRRTGEACHRPPPPRTRSIGLTLHAYLDDAGGSISDWPPDAAVCFNSGFGTLLAPLASPWLQTLAALLRTGAPLLLTCYAAHEASGEAAILRLLGAKTLLPSTANALAHAVPLELLDPRVNLADGDLAELAQRAAEEAAKVEAPSCRNGQSDGPQLVDGGMGGNGSSGGVGGYGASDAASRRQFNVANRFVTCVIGDPSRGEAEATAGLASAEALLTSSAQLFALKNAPAWVACLGDGVPLETVAANAELIARAAQHTRVALVLASKGARAALVAAVARLAAAQAASLGAGTGYKLTYNGAPPALRLALLAKRAVVLLDGAMGALAKLHMEPAEAERPCSEPGEHASYRVVFEGEYVNSRQRPSLNSAVARRLPRGADVGALAQCGNWLRTAEGDWVLRSHPGMGTLLRLVGGGGSDVKGASG